MSAAATPRLDAVSVREAWIGLAGGLLCALILCVTASEPYPTRAPPTELRTLLLTFLPACWLVHRWVRGLSDRSRVAIFALFVSAVVLRVGVLCYVTPIANVTRPYYGALGDDFAFYTVMVRMYARLLTGLDYHATSELRQAVWHLSMLSSIEAHSLWLPNFTMVPGLLVALAGYSVVGVALPMIVASSLLPVALFVMLRPHTSIKVAGAATLWTAFSPSYVLYGICLNKEVPSACALLYITYVMMRRWSPRSLRLWMHLILLSVTTVAARGTLLLLAVVLLVFSHVYWRIRPDRRALATMVLLALAAMARRAPLTACISLVLNAISVPALSWLFTAWSSSDFEKPFLAPVAIVWPIVGGLLAVGLLSHSLGRIRFPRPVLASGLTFLILVGTENAASMIVTRHRIAMEWMLLAYAVAVAESFTSYGRAGRARLTHYAMAITALTVLAHLLWALVKA